MTIVDSALRCGREPILLAPSSVVETIRVFTLLEVSVRPLNLVEVFSIVDIRAFVLPVRFISI